MLYETRSSKRETYPTYPNPYEKTATKQVRVVTMIIRRLLLGLFLVFPVSPVCVQAEIKTITVTHTYNMGDNDSRNDARSICFLEAKRKALEQAGTYIESKTEIKDYKLSREDIFAYSAALLQVETVSEAWKEMGVTLTVRAAVDTDYMLKKMATISKDKSAQNEIKIQQGKIKSLEIAVEQLRAGLNTADNKTALVLRTERNAVVKEIDKREARRDEILERIEKRSAEALRLIRKGMRKDDVLELIGVDDLGNRGGSVYGTTTVMYNTYGQVSDVYGDRQEPAPAPAPPPLPKQQPGKAAAAKQKAPTASKWQPKTVSEMEKMTDDELLEWANSQPKGKPAKPKGKQ